MPIKRELIYPFFLECCQFIDDPYWIQIFEDLSYGKCPYGCYFSKMFLCCSFKGKEFSYKIVVDKDPKILYEEIYHLLFNKLGIFSENQRKSKMKNLEFNDFEWKDKKWNNIKKKTIKDFIIDNFIIQMKKKYELSDFQSNKLKKVILSGILLKTITPKEIIYENGSIIEIKGINFSHKNFTFDSEITNFKFTQEKSQNKKCIRMVRDYHNKVPYIEEEDE